MGTEFATSADLRAVGIDPPSLEDVERAMQKPIDWQRVADDGLQRRVVADAAQQLLRMLYGSPGPVSYLFAFLWRLVAGACLQVFMDGEEMGVPMMPRILSLAARRDAARIADELEGLVP